MGRFDVTKVRLIPDELAQKSNVDIVSSLKISIVVLSAMSLE
jgi:hypothetical protein